MLLSHFISLSEITFEVLEPKRQTISSTRGMAQNNNPNVQCYAIRTLVLLSRYKKQTFEEIKAALVNRQKKKIKRKEKKN